MAQLVKSVQAINVHGRYDFYQEFGPGINILYGENGSGKTTLLHILANILNGDYVRFLYLPFSSITVELDDTSIHIECPEPGQLQIHAGNAMYTVGITKDQAQSPIKEELSLLPAAYFPAFRTMIEAWSSVKERNAERSGAMSWNFSSAYLLGASTREESPTSFARELFGNFVPEINYPSPIEIEHNISEEVERALIYLARIDRDLLARAFIEIFNALVAKSQTRVDTEYADNILDQIRTLSESFVDLPLPSSETEAPESSDVNVYSALHTLVHISGAGKLSKTAIPVLSIYKDLLQERIDNQQTAFDGVNKYLSSVNEFFASNSQSKSLVVVQTNQASSRAKIALYMQGTSDQIGLRALSSGERQIVTLIYAATHMSKQKVVLIDEPEISLNVDWQRLLLNKMAEQLDNRQVIACTHSPVIGADHENMQELRFRLSLKPMATSSDEEVGTGETQIQTA